MSESEAREKASLDWFAGLGDNLVYNEGIYILFALFMGNFKVTKRDYKGLKYGRNSVPLPPLSEGIVPVGTESDALVPYTHTKGGLAIPGYIGPPPQSGLTPGSKTLQLPSGDDIVGEDGGESDSPPSDVTLETNIIPNNFSVTGHIFRSKEGHIQDTAENRFLLESVANNENNFLGYDMYGNQWYALVQPDGRQVWVEARNGIIFDGGINNIPLSWNPKTGLKKP